MLVFVVVFIFVLFLLIYDGMGGREGWGEDSEGDGRYLLLSQSAFIQTRGEKEEYNVSILGRDEGYTVKYNPLLKGVPEGEARGNSSKCYI